MVTHRYYNVVLHLNIQVGSLDLLIKSHWYKCSTMLDGHYLNITLDDDIDMISSQVNKRAPKYRVSSVAP
jgi:hypothetical protein